VVHDTLPNQKKPKNNIMPTYKSFFFYKGNRLFPKIKVYYEFIAQEVKKNTFFEWIFNQKL
jgi:hypothetical protein